MGGWGWGELKKKISSRIGAAKSVRSFLARCSKHCAMTTTLMNSAFAVFVVVVVVVVVVVLSPQEFVQQNLSAFSPAA